MATWLKDTEMSEGDKRKDFSEELVLKVPLAKNLAASGKLQEACDVLLAVEKMARLANDIQTMKQSSLHILEICRESQDWSMLKTQITLLAKRRGQKSSVITSIVQKSMEYVESLKDEAIQEDMIIMLRAVTDGKIFVEKERAILTQKLSQMYEKSGKIDEAANVLQEVHVETYGSMTKLEKCTYILEQVRLTLAKKDFIRAFILSKKILRKTLLEDGFEECKLKFYGLMIEYHTHEDDPLELCRHWLAIYDTPCVKRDPTQWKKALQHAIIFVILSAFSNEQHDLLHRLNVDKNLEDIPAFRAILTLFVTKEIIPYPLPHEQVLQQHPIFATPERGEQWYQMIHTRITEHNIRVVSAYYSSIELGHLAKILGLDTLVTEQHISNLVSNGTIYAKIDRPRGVISFSRPLPPAEQLTNWSADIAQILKLVETTCHLINKENMNHMIE